MHGTVKQAVWAQLAWAAGLACAAAATVPVTVPLTRVITVRHLSQQQAAKPLPVRLTGVVTALSGYRNSFFFQDATAGISVDRQDTTEVHVGDQVEIDGNTSAGLFAPSILSSRVRVIGPGELPVARRVTDGNMFGGAQDSQRIEVEGVVHSVRPAKVFEHDTLTLSLRVGGETVRVILQDFAGDDFERFVDTTVRVRGVGSTAFNEKRQFVGMGMFVPNRGDVRVLQPANADPFAGRSIPVRDALQFGQGQHRVNVAGVVTYQEAGHMLYLQDGDDGIRIQSSSTEIAKLGQRVEVAGFPVMGEYSPVLEDSVFRTTGRGTPVRPRQIEARDVISHVGGFNYAPYDQQMVQLQGKVVESRLQGGQQVWLLQQGDDVFQARVPVAKMVDRMHSTAPGSLLLLTGVCTVQTDADRTPISFGILLRSGDDVVVLKRAPWWTPARYLGSLVALAVAMILVFLWVVILRKRVEHQTRIIRESEKSFRYMAEHDGLTGLLNRVVILSILEREIAQAREHKTGVAIVLCDIDHFKQVNDTRGHLAGDAALRRFATVLSASVRIGDFVGRYGGEEFLLVLTGLFAYQVEERLAVLHSRISNLTVYDQQAEFQITCSLGATFIPEGQCAIEGRLALGKTDHALYQAKEAGRNRVVFQPLAREIA